MKRKTLYIILGVVISIILLVSTMDKMTIDFSIDNLRRWVGTSEVAPLMFIGLWVIRLVAVIPGVTLTILGGLIFTPVTAFTLSLIGLALSDSLVFLVGKSNLFKDFRKKLVKKHGDILKLIDKYNYKFLALGVLCPIAPTDAICYLSSYLGIGYIKYIVTFILANIPALFLYSYLGESYQESSLNTVFIVGTLLITGIMSMKVWNKLKVKEFEEEEAIL